MSNPFNIFKTPYLIERQESQTYQSGYPVRTDPVYYTAQLSVQALTGSSFVNHASQHTDSGVGGRYLEGDFQIYGFVEAELVEATEFADHLIAFGKRYYIKNNFIYINNATFFKPTHHFVGVCVEDGKAEQTLEDFLGENLRITTTQTLRVVP